MLYIHSTPQTASASMFLYHSASHLLLHFLTSPLASASVSSDSWDRSGPTLVLVSSPPPLVCKVCKIWSLGRFQDARVPIQRIRTPKTTRRTPKTFTNIASGGEPEYPGFFLYHIQKSTNIKHIVTDYLHWTGLSFYFTFSYLQGKNKLFCDAHECHGYDAAKDEVTTEDMEGHERCSPRYRCNWYQVHGDSENKLLIEGVRE